MEERRRHKRYRASDMAYIVGLSNPGHITDFSEGGLGIRYQGGEDLPAEFTVDLLHASKSVIIDRVRCRKTRDETKGKVTVFSYVPERRLGIEFLEPSQRMLNSLDLFKDKEN